MKSSSAIPGAEVLRLLTGDCGAHFHTLLSVALDCARALPAERREVSPSAFTLDLQVTKEFLEILSQIDSQYDLRF